ncbi:MAG: NADH:ubiquinone oxidoreductase subunit J [Silanimonas sp.]|nr:MAG: NADH:ubiquinone oxidoreductase subunit J [Silanimonas sp.]
MELIAFYLFAAMAVASALGVITLKNPVHAVLCLVLTFFSTACLFLLLQAEFLGVALVLVYVGAVMVLFLFVVMMLDINTTPLREGFARYLPVAAVVAGLMFVQMLVLMGVRSGKRDVAFPSADPAAVAGKTNLEWIGETLFSGYLYPFEVAAVLLTVAILAAVMLTLRRRPGSRHQDPAKQAAVRKEDRIRIVKMPAETRRQEATE